MITEMDFHNFNFDESEGAKMFIRHKIWSRVDELGIPKSKELVTLLEELEETIFFGWQCGMSKGAIEQVRQDDLDDD